MGTGDISRIGFNPRKHYTSVRMQQGRVIVDDDWNDNERIRREEDRRAGSEIVGAWGTQSSGFKVGQPRLTGGQVDFDIAAGTLYLGGLHLSVDEPVPGGGGETYQVQPDLPVPPTVDAPTDGRMDLVYVEAWEQPVSATEDSELLEPALGGPDTSTRVRTMRRVFVKTDVENDCRSAMQKLADEWTARQAGAYNFNTCECLVDARLRATFDPGQAGSDPCKPAVTGGYLGAENQAIRVQITDNSHFTWGFDNAYPLYRVRRVDGIQKKTGEEESPNLALVTLETLPKDGAHHIRAGQVVEFLGQAATLANGEPVAELTGVLLKAAGNLTPGADQFSVHLDALLPEAIQGARFIRVWDRGLDDELSPEVEFVPGAEKPLGHTGLRVTLDGTHFIPGDYWVIAVRPAAASQVYPWLRTAKPEEERWLPPHGVRRFYAPLAILKWAVNGQSVSGKVVRDCRKRFRPLTEQMVCCTFTVGDGVRSHGDFDTLDEALANLPPEGGVIGMMPGRHTASVTIAGRHNVTIRGCERQTQVVPASGYVLRVEDSSGVVIEELDMLAPAGTAVTVGVSTARPTDITIRRNRILAGECAIRVDGADRVTVCDNNIRMLDGQSTKDVAVYLDADDCEFARNEVTVTRDDNEPFLDMNLVPAGSARALGGIQIAAGSDRVRVIDNVIKGGAGNGIALGSHIGERELKILTYEDPDLKKTRVAPTNQTVTGVIKLANGRAVAKQVVRLEHIVTGQLLKTETDQQGSFSFMKVPDGEYRILPPPHIQVAKLKKDAGVFTATAHELTPAKPLAFVRDVVVRDNRISNMGLCGISNMRYAAKKQGLVKAVTAARLKLDEREYVQLGSPCADLTISGNVIVGCLANDFEHMSEQARARVLGGITLTLCGDLDISDNRIEENGQKYTSPICGIFIAYGERVTIDHNYVCNNGRLAENEEELVPGIRGGIVVTAVSLPVLSVASRGRLPAVSKHLPTCVHGNVVEQPAGRALEVWAMGPLAVIGNQLSTAVDPDGRYGAVMIVNAGRNARAEGNAGDGEGGDPQSLAYNPVELPAGSVLFSDNQVLAGGPRFTSPGAIHITSLHDIGFCNNVSDYESKVKLGQNTYLQAAETIRALGNRFRETVQGERPSGSSGELEWLSLLSRAELANNTTQNQADHCVVAFRGDAYLATAHDANEVLAEPAGCKQFCEELHGKLSPGGKVPPRVLDDVVSVLGELRQHTRIASSLIRNEAVTAYKRFGDQHQTTRTIAENFTRCAEVGRGLRIEEEVVGIEYPKGAGRSGYAKIVRATKPDGTGRAGEKTELRTEDGDPIEGLAFQPTDGNGNVTYNLSQQQVDSIIAKHGAAAKLSVWVGGRKVDTVPLQGTHLVSDKPSRMGK